MRLSELFAPTLREDPAGAEAASHRLLVRAGFIRPFSPGVFAFLPQGLRGLHRMERIVREEMERAGVHEIRIPVTPGRPSEVASALAGSERLSHRVLPLALYELRWENREEVRPRWGLIRGRQFLVAEACTFDRDEEGLRRSSERMLGAFVAVLERCGLTHAVAEAGVGHALLVPAEAGGDPLVLCGSCGYAATEESATAAPPEEFSGEEEALEEAHTPDRPTIRDVAELLGVPAERLLKTMAYEIDGRLAVILVPGDREVSEDLKLRATGEHFKAELVLAADAAVRLLGPAPSP